MHKKIIFPSDFEWGTASASYQIEGGWNEDGKGESIWDRFSHIPGNIADGTNGDVACDFYHRYEEDIKLMKQLGLQVHRFSISWPRIYPDGIGKINQKGIEFYQRVLKCLKENGIKSAVTIYHWDLPQKLQEKGGWANREIVGWFETYAKTLFNEFGDLVDYWITLNEPFCVAFKGYWYGDHAPGYHDFSMAMSAVHNLLLSHGAAVKAFKESGLKSEIGISLNLNLAYPVDKNDTDHIEAAKLVNMHYNELFLDPIFKSKYPAEFFNFLQEKNIVLPEIKPGDMELISQVVDFLGVNHYYTLFVKKDKSIWPLEARPVVTGRPQTDANWEVVPEGIYELLKWIDLNYNPKKIIITENGVACNDWVTLDNKVEDTNRKEYLRQYLIQVHRAIEEGVNVKGYYVWCFCDNFEWAWGLKRRFGIVYVDYNTQRRIPKQSAYWFSDVIKNNGF